MLLHAPFYLKCSFSNCNVFDFCSRFCNTCIISYVIRDLFITRTNQFKAYRSTTVLKFEIRCEILHNDIFMLYVLSCKQFLWPIALHTSSEKTRRFFLASNNTANLNNVTTSSSFHINKSKSYLTFK